MKDKIKIPITLFVFLLFAVLPLFFIPQFTDVNSTPSVIVCSITSMVMCVFFGLAYLKHTDFSFSFIYHPVFLLFTLLTVFVGVSIIESLNTGDAFFEWLRLAASWILFLFLCIAVQSPHFTSALLKCLNILLPVFFMLAINQLFAIIIPESTHESDVWSLDYRFASAFGNKNNYSQCLLFTLPFLVMSFYSLKSYWKGAAVFNIICCGVLVSLMKTLSVFCGLTIAALTSLVVFYFILRDKKRVKQIFIAIALLSIATCAGILTLAKPSDNRNSVFKKVEFAYTYLVSDKSTTMGENSNSVFERLLLWRNSIQMIKEAPVGGVGLANWKLFFPKYGYSGAFYLETDTTKFTKAHNEYLELWCESGIAAMFVFLSLFVSGALYAIKIIKQAKDKMEKLWGFTLFFNSVSFAIVCLFDFPFSRSYQLLLLLTTFAYIINLRPIAKGSNYKPTLKTVRIICFLIFIFATFSLKASLSRLNAEIHFETAKHWQKKKNWSKMQQECEKITSDYFPMDHSATPMSWYKGTAFFMNGNMKAAASEFERAHVQAPYHVQVLNDLGTCYDQLGFKNQAIQCYQKALSINPHFPSSILNLAAVLYNTGNTNAAYAILRTYPARYSNAQSLNFKTVILGKIVDSLVASTSVIAPNKAIIVNEYKQPKRLLKIEAKADSLHISFADYFKTVISEKSNLFSR